MQLIIDKSGNDSAEIYICNTTLLTWKKYQQISIFSKEACGVIIGGYNLLQNQIIVDSCTEPMQEDIRTRNSFILKDKGHQLAVNNEYSLSNGKSFYLGTWHTHPQKKPSPSRKDLLDWRRCIERNPEIPCFLFAIVGTESVFIRVKISKRY